jgi:hypothetical protein
MRLLVFSTSQGSRPAYFFLPSSGDATGYRLGLAASTLAPAGFECHNLRLSTGFRAPFWETSPGGSVSKEIERQGSDFARAGGLPPARARKAGSVQLG